MKASRFQIHRRDFNVASAGYFSVLKTGPRTVNLRQPNDHRYLAVAPSAQEMSTETPEQFADRLRTIKIPLVGDVGMIDRGLVRMALIVLTAVSFTSFILWSMFRGRP